MLFGLRFLATQDSRYSFMLWNLLLATIPLLFAYTLHHRLQTTGWRQPINILLTLLWLGFLPNSFYLLSDLIHLKNTGEINMLYDAVLFASFIFNGYIAGFASLYIIHINLIKRIVRRQTFFIILGILLVTSFAIYLGRSLRWNSWDLVFNPFAIIFDVSESIVDPSSFPQAFVTTGSFFLLLSSIYTVAWETMGLLREQI
ncbi:MAG: DUF1361 domain-containing protein [Candidatus Saccharimonadales bacterium]